MAKTYQIDVHAGAMDLNKIICNSAQLEWFQQPWECPEPSASEDGKHMNEGGFFGANKNGKSNTKGLRICSLRI